MRIEPTDEDRIAKIEIDKSKVIGNSNKIIWMFGIIDRSNKDTRVFSVLDNRRKENLLPIIKKNVYKKIK